MPSLMAALHSAWGLGFSGSISLFLKDFDLDVRPTDFGIGYKCCVSVNR